MALVCAKTGDDGSTEYPEWATFVSTGLVSRILAFMNLIEKKCALKQMADEDYQASVKSQQEAIAYATDIQDLKTYAKEQSNLVRPQSQFRAE